MRLSRPTRMTRQSSSLSSCSDPLPPLALGFQAARTPGRAAGRSAPATLLRARIIARLALELRFEFANRSRSFRGSIDALIGSAGLPASFKLTGAGENFCDCAMTVLAGMVRFARVFAGLGRLRAEFSGV